MTFKNPNNNNKQGNPQTIHPITGMGGGNQNKWRGRRIRISITESELPSNSFLHQNFPTDAYQQQFVIAISPGQYHIIPIFCLHPLSGSKNNTHVYSEKPYTELFVLFPYSSPLVLYYYTNQRQHCKQALCYYPI